jgi:predicted ArsR family transcriptional regulator
MNSTQRGQVTRTRVVLAIEQRGKATAAVVAKAAGVKRRQAQNQLAQLIAAGHVVRQQDGEQVRYRMAWRETA